MPQTPAPNPQHQMRLARPVTLKPPSPKTDMVMISLDTTVLVRYLAQDEPTQSTVASALLERQLSADHPGHVSTLVLAELYCVLTRVYGIGRAQFADIAHGLLTARNLRFDDLQAAWNALQAYEDGLDFVAALGAEQANNAGCDYTATFDPEFSRHPKVRLLAALA